LVIDFECQTRGVILPSGASPPLRGKWIGEREGTETIDMSQFCVLSAQ
jgi:hypothetical protein